MTVQRYLKLLARSLELSNSSINASNIIIFVRVCVCVSSSVIVGSIAAQFCSTS